MRRYTPVLITGVMALLWPWIQMPVNSAEPLKTARPSPSAPARAEPVQATVETVVAARISAGWKEDFETTSTQDWMLIGGVKLSQEKDGHYLTSTGWGAAVWTKPGDMAGVSLSLRYRHGTGIGDIAINGTATDPPSHLYHIGFLNDRLVIGRELKQKLSELGSESCRFQPGKWYNVSISAGSGKIAVKIDGKEIISVTDPDPLPKGLVALGSLSGDGFAYDDISLQAATGMSIAQAKTPDVQPSQDTKPSVALPEKTTGSAEVQATVNDGSQLKRVVDMKPTRPLSFEYWNPDKVVRPSLVPVSKMIALNPVILGSTATPFTLKPGQKTIFKEFASPAPGLYRADVSFARKGGYVTLEWRIEKPNGIPVVQGGKPMAIDDLVKGKSAYYVYFWLTGQDIAGNPQMRLHMELSRNEDWKPSPKPKDTIEQQGGDVGKPAVIDPTITGNIAVVRQLPIPIGQIGQANVPVTNKPNPNQINYPIQYIEMPEYKLVPRPPSISFPLRLTFTPDPNTFREPYVENGTTKEDSGTVWSDVQVICNDTIITQGKTTSLKGITQYELKNPPSGVYRILALGTGDRLQTLMDTGIVQRTSLNWFKPLKQITVQSNLDGGSLPYAYTAVLTCLEASHQSEPDEDSNDEGLGEFKLESNTIVGRVPDSENELKELKSSPQTWLKKHPIFTNRAVYPEHSHIQMPGYGPMACFPDKLLSWWTDDDSDSANRTLGIFSTVVEDDELTWWQEYGGAITWFVKAAVGVMKAAYGGDVGGIINAFKDAVTSGLAVEGVQSVDDIMGHTLYLSSRNQGYGLLTPGEIGCDTFRLFTCEGNSNLSVDTTAVAPPAPGANSPANVSRKVGSVKPWISTTVKIRKVPAPWSRRLRVQMLESQLSYDFCRGVASGPDKTIWWPINILPMLRDKTLEYVPVEPLKDKKNTMQMAQFKVAPSIDVDPNIWERVPARYFEIGLWAEKTGGIDRAFAGIVSMTVYPADILTLAAPNAQSATAYPLDKMAEEAYDRGDTEEVKKNSHVIFYKNGADYIAEFTLHDPGFHMESVKFKAIMEIWPT